MQIAVLLSDIPFEKEAALHEAARLGVTAYEGATVLDPTECMKIGDFLARRSAMLDLVRNTQKIAEAFICDADGAGHPTALGQGISDLDSYIAALLEKGVQTIIIRNVHGTRELEESIRFLKEKVQAYA
ncbi:MAG: hypothetical protein J6L88_04135 [Clostridia bacterium]|nr:hypothetical protein [Clostridia bacterium]